MPCIVMAHVVVAYVVMAHVVVADIVMAHVVVVYVVMAYDSVPRATSSCAQAANN